MSWQNYVDQQLMGSGYVSKAVIAGHDGTLWAKSDNIEVSKICRFLLSPVDYLFDLLATSSLLCTPSIRKLTKRVSGDQ